MDERIAVITGGNRGLGRATAAALADKGFRAYVTARDVAKAEAAVGELRVARDGRDLVAAEMNVGDDESVRAFFDQLEKTEGRIDVLVNNAGAMFEKELPDTSVFSVPRSLVLLALDVNSLGAYRTTQRALPLMNRRGYGRVVNVSSGMGQLAEMGGGYPAYRISKTALSAVTRLFHHEATEGVKVNVVCPGWVKTDMGGPGATRSLDEGIAGIVWAATLDDDGPSGQFFRDGKRIPW